MDKCIMCGTDIPEGRQVCWTCEFKIMQKCNNCICKDTKACLRCDYWKYKDYRTEEDKD